MALNDLARRALRTPDERKALVAAVRDAASHEVEQTWIEWKTGVDLSDRRWHAEIAAQIIAFSNRDPDVAKQHADGCGYLVLGAEPGNIPGIQPIDLADVVNGVTRFTEGPRWNPTYEEVAGVTTLVITVEPPEWGSPIHSIRKEFSQGKTVAYREGAIYVRRPGVTAPASHFELNMLQRRLLASPPLDLELAWMEDPAPILTASATDGEITDWVTKEEERLATRVEDAKLESDINPIQAFASAFVRREERTLEEYQKEVAAFTGQARRKMPARVVGRAAASSLWLRLEVHNRSDRNYSSVQVVLRFDGKVLAFFKREEADLLEGWPSRPWPYGKPRPFTTGFSVPNMGPIAQLDFPRGRIDNSASATITFAGVDVRPHDRVPLEPFRLVALGHGQKDTSIQGEWRLTARDASGTTDGSVTVEVGAGLVTPANAEEFEQAERTSERRPEKP